LTGALGVVAGYLALKAFKRVRDESFLLTAVGFGLITSATVLGAVGCVFLNVYDVTVHIAQSSAVAAGLFSIIYSISHIRGTARARIESQDALKPVSHRQRHASPRQEISER
jgi:hypothetical protein